MFETIKEGRTNNESESSFATTDGLSGVVLVVDDEKKNRVLIDAMLCTQGYQLREAASGEEALEKIAKNPPDMVLLDIMMPGISGFKVARRLKSVPKTRDIPIVMVTALQNVDDRVKALNAGADDFLSKPVDKTELLARVRSSIKIKALRDSEKVLLEKTLNGAINVLSEILSMVEPSVFDHGLKLRDAVKEFVEETRSDLSWETETAAMLSAIGSITVPEDIRKKALNGELMQKQELAILSRIPSISHSLISHIPRLEPVGEVVRHLKGAYPGIGNRGSRVGRKNTPYPSRLLDILAGVLRLEAAGMTRVEAVLRLKERNEIYDGSILDEVLKFYQSKDHKADKHSEVQLSDLRTGDVLVEQVETLDGKLLMSAGNKVTPIMIKRMKNFAEVRGVKMPLIVRRPQ